MPVGAAESQVPIDIVGLLLMITWVGSLQIMLDIGREHDWFADPFVVGLGDHRPGRLRASSSSGS